jgi:hypothetical protein
MKAFREATKFCLEKTLASEEKIKVYLETTAVCLVKVKANTSQSKKRKRGSSLRKREANPKELETVSELRQVSVEEPVVEATRALEDRCGTGISLQGVADS